MRNAEHIHDPAEGIILDAEGRTTLDRWLYCTLCDERLGFKKALPFPQEALPALASLLTKVSDEA